MNEPLHTDNVQLPGAERPSTRAVDTKGKNPVSNQLVEECHELIDRLDSDQLETIRALMEIFLRPRK